MKTTVTSSDKKDSQTYPCIKKYKTKDLIVVFTSISEGIVLYSNTDTYSQFNHFCNWSNCEDTDRWEDFNGSITLSTK